MTKKKVLIFGAAGFVGSNLVRKSLAENAEVAAVDSLEPLLKSTLDSLEPVLSRINFIKCDIRDQQLLKELVPGQDIIFNCAAQTSHPLSVQNPVLDAT